MAKGDRGEELDGMGAKDEVRWREQWRREIEGKN